MTPTSSFDLDREQEELRARLCELRDIGKVRSPWVFVCAAGLIEYLARLVEGQVTGAPEYKSFVSTWLTQIDTRYKSFRYHSGIQDLPVQMYHVLRCGLVHSLSLIPDSKSRMQGGRDRSIALCHREESSKKGPNHLDSYSAPDAPDAALFVVEDFIDHLERVVELIFTKARHDASLRSNMETWAQACPIVRGGF